MSSIAGCIERCRKVLERSELSFGHGTDNAGDEAAWLVLHVLGLPLDGSFADWDASVGEADLTRIQTLLRRRVEERRPLAYLLGEAWFCGLRFFVDEAVLVPRSPLAELIETGFRPWLRSKAIGNALDLCTGSACIAIAMAVRLPAIQVDAVDISEAALMVATRNVEYHGVGERVRLIRSDLFDALEDRTYDLIVSNPPYVPANELGCLPREYSREPAVGLDGGDDGLELVLRILAAAPAYLTDDGVLICEVGESAERLKARLPFAPFIWLEFEHGGGGVFTIGRDELVALAPALKTEPGSA